MRSDVDFKEILLIFIMETIDFLTCACVSFIKTICLHNHFRAGHQ